MKTIGEATPQDQEAFFSLVAEGEKPIAAFLSLFEATEKDAELFATQWLKEKVKAVSSQETNLETILTKDGALKRLAVLALFGENEEIQRKAVMDIAKLQKWVDETPHISQTLLTCTLQEGEAFLREHASEVEAMLIKAKRGAVHPRPEPR